MAKFEIVSKQEQRFADYAVHAYQYALQLLYTALIEEQCPGDRYVRIVRVSNPKEVHVMHLDGDDIIHDGMEEDFDMDVLLNFLRSWEQD